MQDEPPSGGLKWVKRDIIAGLERVGRAATGDEEPGDAVTALFEVRGMLLALPLPAAALLAEEMQRCCEALAGAAPEAAAPAREPLGRALPHLRDYIESIDAGERDEPLRLLDPINVLRTARSSPPVSAAELLLPASVPAPFEPPSSETLQTLTRIARKVRPHFHRSLVRWFNGEDPQRGLLILARLFNQTRRCCKDGPIHELFLAAEGVIQGVLDGTIVGDAATKALIGRLDKVLKPMVAEQPAWPDELASALLSDFLARLSHVPPGSPVLEEGAPAEHDTDAADGDDEDLAFLDDADLIAVFADEARELLDGLERELRDWREQGIGMRGLAAARRQLHTLKGNARMAGLLPIGDLSHGLETLLQTLEPDAPGAEHELLALLQEGLDALAVQVDAAAANQPVPVARDLLARLEGAAAGTAEQEPPAAEAVQPATHAAAAEPGEGGPESTAVTPATFRIGTDWLDAMIVLAGEIGTYGARMVAQNTRLGLRAAQLDESLKRVTRRLERVSHETELPGGSGSRLERRLAQLQQALAEAGQLGNSVGELQRDTSDLLRQQQRLTADLQDGLLGSRMIPFDQIEARLHRLLRRTAVSLGKEVALVVYGGSVELDRHVLERFVAPLEHLLRNAIVHGIEAPAVRKRRGKPPHGYITISVERHGDDILCSVSDDGAGMDLAQIRAHAEALGLILPGATLSEEEILALTLQPGFSTAETVTQLAGRGVGLDVVSEGVAALNGDLELHSEAGAGVSFKIRLPLTLSIAEALLMTAGGTLYAVPHGTILAVARVPREQVVAGGEVSVRYQDEDYRVLSLADTLEARGKRLLRRAPPNRRWLPVLLVQAGSDRVAVQVDTLIGSQRVMIKPIGPPLGALRWLNGGTLLADGRVALLLDLTAVLRADAAGDAGPREHSLRLLLMNPGTAAQRLGGTLRARTALHMRTARNETQAQELIDRAMPDLVLLDAAADDADPVALARRLRADERLARVPVLLVADDADAALQAEACAAGIDRVLVEPVDEDALVAGIETLLRASRP